MLLASYADILRAEGFQPIGDLNYRVNFEAWWNPAQDRRVELLVLSLGERVLIRGQKSYYMQSVTSDGETWARDIPQLHAYLETHFPELRISFSHFRDVPSDLADREARRRLSIDAPTQTIPSVEDIAGLQRRLNEQHRHAQATERLLTLSDVAPDLVTSHMRLQSRSVQRETASLEGKLRQQRQRAELLRHLQHEFLSKGSAATYCMSITSNVHVVEHHAQFRDLARAVTRELTDYHRYQIKQKLGGGRLNIQVEEADEPAITWLEQWFAGGLSPMQLSKLQPAFQALKAAGQRHVMITADEPIAVDGHVRQAEKRLAARFVSNAMSRLDRTGPSVPRDMIDLTNVSLDAMPMRLGRRVDDNGNDLGAAIIPLASVTHASITGTTGSGKSFLARTIVEEAAEHDGLNILILDPRNQFAGLLVAENRAPILQRYDQFGMQTAHARGFPFRYFAPATSYAPGLPAHLSTLATGRSVVSFKNVDDERRCSLAHHVLDAVFTATSVAESDRPRLLIVVDEAQLMTRRRVDGAAKNTAAATEKSLDRIAREGRKYGIVLVLVAQTIMDFSHELASLRQMTTTKIFCRNSDREVEYANDIIGDGRVLVQLTTGSVILHNANWGVQRIRVRPPYSKVFELGEADIRKVLCGDNKQAIVLSSCAQTLLLAIKQNVASSDQPMNLSRAAALTGISSKRKLHELVAELERSGVIRTRLLVGRGRPRLIELISQQP